MGYLFDGYGRFKFEGKMRFLAHRASWIIHFGPIPEGLCVCHTCDNRKCVNPKHLFLGSNYDNIIDRALKNRSNRPFGNKFTTRKITEDNVRAIRQMLKEGIYQRIIAEKYGISQKTVSKIKLELRWKHVK